MVAIHDQYMRVCGSCCTICRSVAVDEVHAQTFRSIRRVAVSLTKIENVVDLSRDE